MCFVMFQILKHFVSCGETLCFSVGNTLFLPEKLFLQDVSSLQYDVMHVSYDVCFLKISRNQYFLFMIAVLPLKGLYLSSRKIVAGS